MAVALAMAALSPFAATAAQKATGTDPHAANEIEAKAPPDYVALPRFHLAVEVDANKRYRALDLEVWLHPKGPENLQLANSKKKMIGEAVKEDLANYDWEAFEDVKAGPEIARKVIQASVQRASGAELDEVYIRTLVLH
jgi:hypothetical protein